MAPPAAATERSPALRAMSPERLYSMRPSYNQRPLKSLLAWVKAGLILGQQPDRDADGVDPLPVRGGQLVDELSVCLASEVPSVRYHQIHFRDAAADREALEPRAPMESGGQACLPLFRIRPFEDGAH